MKSLFSLLLVVLVTATSAKPNLPVKPYKQILLYRATGPTRTYRLRYGPDKPVFTNGWTDETYQIKMDAGSPSQSFKMTVDFGWGPTFLFGDSVSTPQTQSVPRCARTLKQMNFYDAGVSNAFNPLVQGRNTYYTYDFKSPYVPECAKERQITGQIVSDDFQIDDQKFKQVPFVLTDRLISTKILHAGWPADGIFGLGNWDGMFEDGKTSFVKRILETYGDAGVNVAQKLITVYLGNTLRSQYSPLDEPAAWLTIGGIDKEHCDGNGWHYVKPARHGIWAVNVDGFTMGNYQPAGSAAIGLLTSPTAFIYAPGQIRDGIARKLGAEYDVQLDLDFVDCNRRGQMPTMQFDLQGYKYKVKPEYYARQLNGVNGPNPRKQCVLMVGSSNNQTWYLGTTFNRPKCVLFDYAQKRLAFADSLMH
ncbi:Eukaryotic aspartyl protease [Aphelenchoides bicaudatus]|nr:Eukaryotic aspartyl protease [Aphelenchoides bicaudatus]